jgi:NADPH-dependent curcumin reductase CurA
MAPHTNQQWRLASRPVGCFKASDFQWSEEPLGEPGDGEALVRNIYLSLDPTSRGWAGAVPTYLPPVEIGEVMRGFTLGVVERSRHPQFHDGDLVTGLLGWQEYALASASSLTRLPRDFSLPLTAYFGLLGHIGATAYFGLLDVGRPKAGETLVISAAAGAVGSLVGQIGKINGCHVVGIAGSDDKCRWLVDELGFDGAVNYKAGRVRPRLRRQCPDGIDVYFDNVGGETLDAVLRLINLHARIVICGLISQYNAVEPVPGPYYFPNVLTKRARVEGVIILDYADRFREAEAALIKWHSEGKIRYRVDVVDGLEQAPVVVNRLFDGSNQGKLIVKVAEEPSV